MPATTAVHYLNIGTSGPLPKMAVDAMQKEIEKEFRSGRYLPFIKELYADMDIVRNYLAGILGVSYEEIGLTQSTTEGLNIILWGLSWKPGDEVITTNMEHPASLAPLALIKSRYQIATAMNRPLLLGLQKSLEYLLEHLGIDWITARVPRLARYTRELIGNLPGVELITPEGQEAGFVHFHVKGWGPQDLCSLLNKKRFMVRPVPKPHLPMPTRISTGFYNTEEELELFAEALSELIN